MSDSALRSWTGVDFGIRISQANLTAAKSSIDPVNLKIIRDGVRQWKAWWAAHRDDLDQFAARLRKEGIEFEGPQPGSRQRPDGKVLHWKALRLKDDRGGLLPFFIEWSADTKHPSVDAPRGCHLESFTLLAPDPDALSKTADQLGLGVTTSKAAEFQIRAVIACAGKELRLTS